MPRSAPWLAAKLVLLGLFVALTNSAALLRVGELARRDEPLLLAVFGGLWLACAVPLVLAAFLPGWRTRLLWGVVFAASAFAVFAYEQVAGARLTLDDALVLWVERSHAGDALAVWGSGFARAALAALLGVAAFALRPLGPGRRVPGARWLGRLGWTPLLPFALLAAILLVRGGRGTDGLPAQWNGLSLFATAVAIDWTSELPPAEARSAPAPDGPRRARHVVLVIDESVRGDFVGSDPPSPITPWLAALEPRPADFGRAVAAGNCSNSSNAVIRLGVSRDDLSAGARLRPPVWGWAHAAGYRTVYVDAQRQSGGLQNWMTLHERAQIDEFVQFEDTESWDADAEAARQVRERLARPEPQFVLVNKRGAHFPYERDYPEDAAVFTPDRGDGVEAVENAYRNAVRWSVDGFFQALLDGTTLGNTALLYTSDHGQHLGARVPHCNTSTPHPTEALVPMLALAGAPELRGAFAQAARQNRGRTTHFEIFPTLLWLFGYAPERIRADYGPGLLDPLEPGPRAFTVGPVLLHFGRDVRWKPFPPELLTP